MWANISLGLALLAGLGSVGWSGCWFFLGGGGEEGGGSCGNLSH